MSEQSHIRGASERLHLRVQRFIRASLSGDPCEPFATLAGDIARFQRAHVEPVARLMRSRGLDDADLDRLEAIPAMPCDAFRLRRIASHPEEEDLRCFETSGTSQGQALRGRHPLRDTATYELGALGWGARMLWPDRARPGLPGLGFVGLVASEGQAPRSSLTFMLARFAAALGGEVSWHLDDEGRIDLERLIHTLETAREPLLMAGTSFAFVHLGDALAGRLLPLPAGSRLMQTGGYKGRSREVDAVTLRQQLARTFALDEAMVVAEYGMTELSSQLYQASLARHVTSEAPPSSLNSYHPPPWLAVSAVDPTTLEPVSPGEIGLCRLVDLANVDSSVAVQTSDQVRLLEDGSIELLGRAPGATPRGCSLALEHLIEEPGR